MARAALDWTVRDLAEATGLHRNTITNIEVGRYAGNDESLASIERVFRATGIEFFGENGVSLVKPEKTKKGQSSRG
jgi:DNA-binding XRE family transcriptional regulator